MTGGLLKWETGGAPGGAGATKGAGAAARGGTEAVVGAKGSTWEGAEGAARGATIDEDRGTEKPGGGGCAGPAGLRGQSTGEASSGGSG